MWVRPNYKMLMLSRLRGWMEGLFALGALATQLLVTALGY